ncbi:MAG: methyltransferase domain-containing protein [Anaerolineales bacterium]|jgi:2-polyprenyl-3-methyl-5-hydroxy-6-metoxy-1,4-benzoquinol methylase|nr:methyltransferase domain-containing protein [Anaerolineales bacterium]
MLPLDHQNQLRERYRKLRPGWHPSGEVYEDAVRRHLRAEMHVLDLGCGRGGLPEKLADEVSKLFGIDAHWNSLAAYRDVRLRLCSGQSERLPFRAGTFQIITSTWLLEHLNAPHATMLEIRRVLAPGGHFIFLTPNIRNPLVLANRLSGWLPVLQRTLVRRLYGRKPADTFPLQYRANTHHKLQQLSRDSGLQLLSLETVRDPTYAALNLFLFRALIALEDILPGDLGVHLVGILRR